LINELFRFGAEGYREGRKISLRKFILSSKSPNNNEVIILLTMKLSIALSTILVSQPLPLVSEAKLTTWLLDGKDGKHGAKDDDENHRLEKAMMGRARDSPQHQHGLHMLQRSGGRYRRNKNMKLVNSQSGGKTKTVVCDPSSSDPDVGVLSCGSDAVCMADDESLLGGFCVSSISSPHPRKKHAKQQQRRNKKNRTMRRNSRPSDIPKANVFEDGTSKGGIDLGLQDFPKWVHDDGYKSVECVPGIASTEADVGMLGCGIDEICVESVASDLGGKCVPSFSPRRLGNATEVYGRRCFQYSRCDCSSFDRSTGTGSIVCSYGFDSLSTEVYGCYELDYREHEEYVYENGEVISGQKCYTFVARGEESKSSTICLPCHDLYPYPERCSNEPTKVPETMTLNGQACTSCGADSYCDCTNVVEGAMITFYYFLGSPVVNFTSVPSFKNATSGSMENPGRYYGFLI